MLERFMTPKMSRDVVRLLVDNRGWSIAKIARTIGAHAEYVRRVQAAKQTFLMQDFETLGKACRQDAHLLYFDSIRPEKLSPDQKGLYELTRKEIERHQQFERQMRDVNSSKKRRPRKNAA